MAAAPPAVAPGGYPAASSGQMHSAVATVILKGELTGTEDPAAVVKRGGLELEWVPADGEGPPVVVKKFREKPQPHVVDADLCLPTLYLHFVDDAYRLGHLDHALRSGNDSSEVMVVVREPEALARAAQALDPETKAAVLRVLKVMRTFGQVPLDAPKQKAGGFGPKRNVKVTSDKGLFFSLRTARPKATISLDKKAFGIPDVADHYLFVNNHDSVVHLGEEEREAFEKCIEELPARPAADQLHKFGIFMKLFYEGGFGYNKKEFVGESKTAYCPINVGLAAMSVEPAFPDQAGISTGYPYLLRGEFLPFVDTVPISIRAIEEMSPRHGRYGLGFTRSIFVWEGDAFKRENVLDFCSVLPHGGFFYVPKTLGEHEKLGGLVYAFGEARSALEVPVDAAAIQGAAAPSAAPAPADDHRVCVVCLDETATMAALPCGHRAYCKDCGPKITGKPCPVCRADVRECIRIFG